MNNSTHKWEVKSEESRMSLLAFLKSKLDQSNSAKQVKRAIESNRCQVNGRTERFASAMLGKGDVVTFLVDTEKKIAPPLHLERSLILFEDDDLLMINKPSGYASEGKELERLLKKHAPSLELLHRLDKETTGVLMYAKHQDVREKIIAMFRKHLVKKGYSAIVDGIPDKNAGVIDNYLGKLASYEGQSIWGAVSHQKGLHAVTQWQLEKKGKEASLIRCFPRTGRTHQLRVHLNELGHPILGDFQYSRQFKCPYRPGRFLLHAEEITFQHPTTDDIVCVKAPLPDDFLAAMKHLSLGERT